MTLLHSMPPGVERELFGYRFKHKFFPGVGLFSTKHNGDWTGNLLLTLERKLKWEEINIVDGKKVVMEYERNYNNFVQELIRQALRVSTHLDEACDALRG